MKKEIYMNNLFDYYGELLTEKQQEYFKYYYFDNLSLSEIAENLNLSRNAIHKQLKQIEEKLKFYDDKLKLIDKDQKLLSLLDKIENKYIKNELLKIIEL